MPRARIIAEDALNYLPRAPEDEAELAARLARARVWRRGQYRDYAGWTLAGLFIACCIGVVLGNLDAIVRGWFALATIVGQ